MQHAACELEDWMAAHGVQVQDLAASVCAACRARSTLCALMSDEADVHGLRILSMRRELLLTFIVKQRLIPLCVRLKSVCRRFSSPNITCQ